MAAQPDLSGYSFFRAAALLIGGIIGVALLLDVLLLQLGGDGDTGDDDMQPLFALVALQLEAGLADGGDLPVEFNARRRDLENALGMPVELLQRSDFAGLDDDLTSLAAGAIITLFDSDDRPIYYQRLPGSGYVLAIGPDPVARETPLRPRLVTVFYYLLVGLLVLFWVRPFYRDLDRLRHAALQFGSNDFSARVHVADSSRILPVAQSFNAMAERIEYLVSSHQELTNAVSHELRTPLARFKFSLEILARAEDPAKKEEYLAHMKQDVEELEKLIDEMLSYAKLSEQNLLLELVDMDAARWLEDLVAAYPNDNPAVALRFHNAAGGPCRATFNPDLMARAVTNILRNCLRYAESAIDIGIDQDRGRTTITISDDGKGIEPGKLATLFEPFTRGDTSRDRESGGYGLGLAIAARIVERHQGRIEAGNTAPHGARFTISW